MNFPNCPLNKDPWLRFCTSGLNWTIKNSIWKTQLQLTLASVYPRMRKLKRVVGQRSREDENFVSASFFFNTQSGTLDRKTGNLMKLQFNKCYPMKMAEGLEKCLFINLLRKLKYMVKGERNSNSRLYYVKTKRNKREKKFLGDYLSFVFICIYFPPESIIFLRPYLFVTHLWRSKFFQRIQSEQKISFFFVSNFKQISNGQVS